jgi:cytochrome c oxidase cbb3-type subunit 3
MMSHVHFHPGLLAAALVCAAVLAVPTGAAAQSKPRVVLPPEGQTSGVPIGDVAGGAQADLAPTITGQTSAADVTDGQDLFIKLNCAGCHGFGGTGGMGPNLTDKAWIFGGTPAAIFKSIFQGRPDGMPAWGSTLPARDIWQLVAYIDSLGGAVKPEDYQSALQGDVPGELVAPELGFENALDGSPPDPSATEPGVPYPEKQP